MEEIESTKNHADELPFLFKKLLGAVSGRRAVVLELLLWMGAHETVTIALLYTWLAV